MDKRQRQCVESVESNLMIVAGPGSGKTATLIETIVHRVKSGMVHPSRIGAITFTRLAAYEMKRRLQFRINEGIWVGTFHSLCYEIVAEHWQRLGFASSQIAVYDSVEQMALIDETIKSSRHRVGKTKVRAFLDEWATSGAMPDSEGEMEPIVQAYLRALLTQGAVDYPTVVILATSLVRESPEAFPRWTDLFVDECQDLNWSQWRFVRDHPAERKVMVGDPDQLIYGWRGAEIGTMRRMQQELGAQGRGASVTFLENNYRSGPQICAAGNKLIALNEDRYPKQTISKAVIDDVVERIPNDCFVEHVREAEGTVAILGRTHRTLNRWWGTLHGEGVEAELVGEREHLLESEAVRTVIAYMVWPGLPDNPRIAERVLKQEGLHTIEVQEVFARARSEGRSLLEAAALTHDNVSAMYDEFEEEALSTKLALVLARLRPNMAIEPKQEAALAYLVSVFIRTSIWEKRTSSAFVAWLNLRDTQDEIDLEAPLQMMTIHASKGLEFDTVYIVGLSAHVFPHKKSMDIEEERRLMFVALTRARRRVVLVTPNEEESRFVDEVLG